MSENRVCTVFNSSIAFHLVGQSGIKYGGKSKNRALPSLAAFPLPIGPAANSRETRHPNRPIIGITILFSTFLMHFAIEKCLMLFL
jgi:hypothetical protein